MISSYFVIMFTYLQEKSMVKFRAIFQWSPSAPRKVMQAIFETMLQGDLPIDEAFREGVMSVVGVEVTYGLLRRYNRIK